MKLLQFAAAQESRFQSWKFSYMGSAVLLSGRFANFQETRFQTA